MPGTILIGVDVEMASENSRIYARRGAELFASEGVPATWYLTGLTLEKYPNEFAQVERAGLGLVGHGAPGAQEKKEVAADKRRRTEMCR